MVVVLNILVTLLLIIVLLWLLFFSILFFSFVQSKIGGAPFISTPDHVTPYLIKEFSKLNGDFTFLEIGCGDGKIIKTVAENFNHAKIIGVEISIIPFLLAKFTTRNYPHVTILYKNIFDVDIAQVNVIYTYLFPALLEKLYPYLEKNLKRETLLVSCDFMFSKKDPIRTLVMHTNKHHLGKKLVIYEF